MKIDSPNLARDRYGDNQVLDLISSESFTLTVSGLRTDLGYQLLEVFYCLEKSPFPILDSKL